MKCKRCKEEAIVALPSHNTGFCEPCFEHFFMQQVIRGIEYKKMCSKNDRILVALSGGKDSLCLMYALHSLGYDVTGLHIDLAIGESSEASRKAVESFCNKHGLAFIVHNVADDDLAIPLVKNVVSRPVCSICGTIKRYFFNKIAIEGGYTALATGHNLDDEVARLFSNTLRWDMQYLANQAPCLPAENGFAKRIKPLWRLTEFEIANFAFIKGVEHHYAPCPFAKGATHTFYKHIWHELEEKMPGRKLSFYIHFLEYAKEKIHFAQKQEYLFPNSFSKNIVKQDDCEHSDEFAPQEKTLLNPCRNCAMPTSAPVCSVCQVQAAVRKKQKESL